MTEDVRPFSTPVLLLVFNRPDYLRRMIKILRRVKPTLIYISGDGAREGNEQDMRAIEEINSLLTDFDWKCRVRTNFSRENLGCKVGVSQGISWFFDQVSEGIVLEDDCMPDISFFPYAQELLERYRLDESVGMISGNNFFGTVPMATSYCFSIHPECWGWATWKRAWKKYDVSLSKLDSQGEKVVSRIFPTKRSQEYWLSIFKATRGGEINTWDYQWIFTCWQFNMLCVVPARNLVTNIGFDARATHTRLSISPNAFQKHYFVNFPLIHPNRIVANVDLDRRIQSKVFERRVFLKLGFGVINYLKRIFNPDARMIDKL